MRPGRRITTWLVAATVVIGVPGTAMAAPGVASKDVGSAERVRDFWTQKRMAEAEPLSAGFVLAAPSEFFDASSAEPPAPQAPPQSVAPTNSSAPTTYDDAVTIGDTTPQGIRTHGKIFLKLGGGFFICSGTVVSSQNESTVWTAAHCLFDQRSRKFAKNLIFIPAYDKNVRPFGTWTAKELHVTRQWKRSGPESSDFGSALMQTQPAQKSCAGLSSAEKRKCKQKNRSAQTIQDEVGSRGIAFNQPINQKWTAYGYPAAPQPRFDGQDLEACTGKLKKRDPREGPPAPIGIDCDMQGGASGGGWVIDGDTVNGNVAYGYPDIDLNTVYSPYFGTTVQAFYGSVEDCPLLGCN